MSDVDSTDWLLAKAGDSAALARLVGSYSDRLFNHASRFLSVREDAKDAVAIAFFELWRRRDSVRTVEGSPLPWLLNTVSNTARNVERSRRRYRGMLGRLETPERQQPPPLEDESGVIAALDRLPPRERSVIVLSVIEGYPVGDIATALGIPHGTVKSRLSRGKARLRSHLADLAEA